MKCLCLFAVTVLLSVTQSIAQSAGVPLRLVQTIALPKVQGRIDHFNVDTKHRRLFIAALGNHSIEVVDLKSGKWVRSLAGFKKPQGVWYVESIDKLFIADGEDGNCKVYRGSDLRLLNTIPLDLGPDHEAYDPVRKALYVGYGGEDAGRNYGELGIIDTVANKHTGDVRTDAHPGAVIIENPGKTVLVTNPKAQEIAVVDEKARAVTAKWVIPEQLPVALALDQASKRLFVGTRKPPLLLVFDEASHKLITTLPSVGLMDDMYFDAHRRRIYVSGGEGFVFIYQQLDPDHYKEIAKIQTGATARTSLLVPEFNRYYVAVPAAQNRGAEIQVYEPRP